MPTAADVAKHILKQTGEISTMKLQKLVYYAQAYKLGWTGERMYHDPVHAWTNGPVIYTLFKQHEGQFSVTADHFPDADSSNLTTTDQKVIGAVLEGLSGLTGWELRCRTHEEEPWRNAYRPSDERHHREITTEEMASYYH